jgi:branched-chain amino acid transport system permease protein
VRLFVQAVILGLLAGGVYALMASGLTLAFGIMRVINVAQGVMIILGAYLSYTLFTRFSIDPFLSVLIVVPVVFVLGVVIELIFIRPLRPSDRESLSLLVTWAVALGIEGVLGLVYSTTYRATIPSYANGSWRIGGFVILQVQMYAFALSVGSSPAGAPAREDEVRPGRPRHRAEPAAPRCSASMNAGSPRSGSGSAWRRPPRPEPSTAS